MGIYFLESHSLQLLRQTFVFLGYILLKNDSAFTDHNIAFTQMQDEVFSLDLVLKYVRLS
jgi:hypothetical protein